MHPFDEHEAAAELRSLMLAVEVPDSAADVQRAITTGRRARMRMVVTGGATAVVVLAAVGTFVAFGPMRAGPSRSATPGASAVAAGPQCVPTELEMPAGSANGVTTSIDSTGHIVGGYVNEDQPTPVLWRDGRPEVVPNVSGMVTGVASDGTVVGFALVERQTAVGWVVRDGHASNLATAPGYQWATATAVNSSGTVVGTVSTSEAGTSVPAVWSADGTVHLLAIPAGTGDPKMAAVAEAIADDGTVAGEVYGTAFWWSPDGTPHSLAPLPGATDGVVMGLAGHYAYGTSGNRAARWDLRTGEVVPLPVPMQGATGARSGTASGLALINGENFGMNVLRPANGAAIALKAPTGGGFAGADAISADGSTVAGTFAVGDVYHPLVWHCG